MRPPTIRVPASVSYDSAKSKPQAVVESHELRRYRSLIRNLVARDLKVRYKRSALGVIWVLLNPLLTTIVLSTVVWFLFGKSQPNYPSFVLGSLLIWSLFAQGSVAAMFYPITILPPFIQPLEQYNPMYLFISAAQKAVVGSTTQVGGKLVTLAPSIPDVQTQLVA